MSKTTTTATTRSDALRSLEALRSLIRSSHGRMSKPRVSLALHDCDLAFIEICRGNFDTAIEICEHRTFNL
jgi:hypothetical protein